jgi:hypothetical protein
MTPWLGALAASILALAVYVVRMAYKMGTLQAAIKNAECVPALKLELKQVTTMMNMYQQIMAPALAKILCDWPTHKERDILMEKLNNRSLSLTETDKLDCLLKDTIREAEHDQNRQLQAAMARVTLSWYKIKLESEHT